MERKKARRASSPRKRTQDASAKSKPRSSPRERPRERPRGEKQRPFPQPSDESLGLVEQNQTDLIFGRHTVIAAMEHERPLNKIWILPQLKRNSKLTDLLSQSKARGAIIDETTALRLDQLTQYATHQGIVAQVGACRYIDLQALISTAREHTPNPVLIAVDGITDPHNLGAIIRSAEAMGAQGIVLPQRRTASVGATVAKVAAGALETLPISRVVNLNQALESLKQENYWVYGLTLDASEKISDIELSGAIVLLIGSEGKGLSHVAQKHCDEVVRIPLAGHTQSLNASVAAGIGIYEIFRQRLSQKG